MSWELPVTAVVVLILGLYWGLRGVALRPIDPERLTLGVTQGSLQPCPDIPNCVSSQAPPEDETHYVPPIRYRGSPEQMAARILELLRDLPRVRIVTEKADYIHAEFRTRLIGFVDDVEFYLPQDGGIVHLRSASRVGQADLGVNRRRYHRLVRQLEIQNSRLE
jgi:uncharacterized protein (DUF1499 family)